MTTNSRPDTEARASAGEAAAAPADNNPNRPGAWPWSTLEREAFREAVVRHAKAHSPNALRDVSPRDADLASCLRVIRIAEAARGRALHLAVDGEAGEAMCWLA